MIPKWYIIIRNRIVHRILYRCFFLILKTYQIITNRRFFYMKKNSKLRTKEHIFRYLYFFYKLRIQLYYRQLFSVFSRSPYFCTNPNGVRGHLIDNNCIGSINILHEYVPIQSTWNASIAFNYKFQKINTFSRHELEIHNTLNERNTDNYNVGFIFS